MKIMKKTLLVLAVILFNTTSYSQNELEKAAEKLKTETQETNTQKSETDEPEWVGQAIYLDNGKITELESQKAYIKANASASMFIVGVGKVKSKYIVKGNKSDVRIKSSKNLSFIVNAGTNSMNPKSVFKIVKLLTKKKNKRYYIGSSAGTFTGSKVGDLELITFRAKKYGKSSYKIEIPNIENGEYALIVNSSMDWNLFGIE
jgi:hypothetical protein